MTGGEFSRKKEKYGDIERNGNIRLAEKRSLSRDTGKKPAFE